MLHSWGDLVHEKQQLRFGSFLSKVWLPIQKTLNILEEQLTEAVFMQGSSSCQPEDAIHLVFSPFETIMPVSWDCFWAELVFKCLASYSVYCSEPVTPCRLFLFPVSFPLSLSPPFSLAWLMQLSSSYPLSCNVSFSRITCACAFRKRRNASRQTRV